MTEAKLEAILSRQTPDEEKRRRAHFVIDTRGKLELTRAIVAQFVRSTAALTGGRTPSCVKSCSTRKRQASIRQSGHRVLEIGAVEIVHQSLTGNVFHVLINPERDVPEDAARVHGHTAEVLKDKPVFAKIVDDFLAFIGDSKLVIHNAEFDVRFVNAELASSALPRSTWTGSSTRLRWREKSTPDSRTVSTLCVIATASTARGGSGMARCLTRRFLSRSIAS